MPVPFQNRVRRILQCPPLPPVKVVGLGGLEPPTSPLSGARSNHLSYRPVAGIARDGGASRDRTDDPLLAKQVLSQLSYGPGSRHWGQTPSQAGGQTTEGRKLVRTPEERTWSLLKRR